MILKPSLGGKKIEQILQRVTLGAFNERLAKSQHYKSNKDEKEQALSSVLG